MSCVHGSSLSLLDYSNLGSSLSVRSFVRFGSSISVDNAVQFSGSGNKIEYNSALSQLEMYAGAERGISITNTGGVLHGTWTSDSVVGMSDRRLKNTIVPLYKAIAAESKTMPESEPTEANHVQQSPGGEKAASVGWVLRQLRPVSFKFKSGPEAKYSRYGFIAQELQQVLPNMVRGTADKHLSVVYQDMIALLTLAAQVLQDKASVQEEALKKLFKSVEALTEKVDQIMERQEKMEQRQAQPSMDRQIQNQPFHDKELQDAVVAAEAEHAQRAKRSRSSVQV